MRYRSLLKMILPVLLLTGSATPSWAGGGFGFGLGLGLGALFTADVIANSYPPYYANPYYQAPYYPAPYAPYNYPPPYAYPAPQPMDNSAYAQAYAQPPEAATVVQGIRPDTSQHNLTVVNDYHLELHALLDEKLKEGDITKQQYEAEVRGLDQLDRQAHAKATANGGYLTGDQESALVRQYQRAYYIINRNLVVN